MENELTEKITKKNVLVYFSEPITEKLYKQWAKMFNIPAIDGQQLTETSSREYKEVKQSKKVLLIIVLRGADETYVKKIQEIGFKNENITLFTVQYLQSEMCIYARKQGIKVVQLPLLESKLEDYI